MVETLLALGLTNALMALALALVAALAGLVCRRPALVHSLWLLVLLKLVAPPLALVPLAGLLPPVMSRPQVKEVLSPAAPEVVDRLPLPDMAGPATPTKTGDVLPVSVPAEPESATVADNVESVIPNVYRQKRGVA